MQVVIIKFTNGDEVLARLENSNSTEHFISKPRQLVISGDRGGLMPYLISMPDAENVSIARSAVVAMFNAPKDVADGYLSATSSLILG